MGELDCRLPLADQAIKSNIYDKDFSMLHVRTQYIYGPFIYLVSASLRCHILFC